MNNHNCSYWKCSNAIGLFLVILLVLCFIWVYINPVEQDLHTKLFKLSYLGFSGMNILSLVLAAIQTYIFGYILVGIWSLVGCCNKTCLPRSKEQD